jgi:DNA invertase Pin-like site-specific DNA recombinase
MSTEHQQYSTENQSIAILQYAQLHNMEIVHTYADHGKSGLDLTKRAGLRQLLKDAISPGVSYRAVLVYDVSRWGRFQNPDQGASYEYALTAANVPVHYCAEQFKNDGSLSSAILKSLKRGMAGEYSRELSVKVWAGQSRLVQLGFRLGGIPGYGLRRHLIDHNRAFKQTLTAGDRKSLQSDRVILVPGPPEEVKVVRKIYRWFIKDLLTEKSISERLNGAGIAWIGERPWNAKVVREVLANPKYIGSSVYNRKSSKLHKRKVHNPPGEWICHPNAFKPLVSVEQFEDARVLLSSRSRFLTTDALVDRLRQLLRDRGYLSSGLITSVGDMPALNTYRKRFGNLKKAYALAKFDGVRNIRLAETDAVIKTIQKSTEHLMMENFARTGVQATYLPHGRSSSIVLDDEAVLRVIPVRCSQSRASASRWFVQIRPEAIADIMVIVRLDQANTGVLDYFIFPRGIITSSYLKLTAHNSLSLEIFRFRDLSFLETLTRRQTIQEIVTSTDATLYRGLRTRTRLYALRSLNDDRMSLRSTGALGEPRIVSGCRESFKKQIDLVSNAELLERRALALACSLNTLLADEDFRTVLRAENIRTIPQLTSVRELLLIPRMRLDVTHNSRAPSFNIAKNGLSLNELSDLLPADRSLVRLEAYDDKGLDPVTADILHTYPVRPSALSLLKRLKPERQVEIAEQMVAHANWGPTFVRVLMYASKSHLFVDGIKERRNRNWSVSGTRKFAAESDSLYRKLKALGPNLGQSFLLLATFQRYASVILKNVNVRSFIARRHPDAIVALQESKMNVW